MSTLSVDTIQGQTAAANVKMPAGAVLQVVSATTATQVNIASTSFTDTGLTATITPKYNTSKVMIIISQHIGSDRDNDIAGNGLILLRGGTTLQTHAYASHGEAGSVGATKDIGSYSYTHLDSPNTTSATTYKTQAKSNNTSNNGAARCQWGSSPSHITLMEISV